MIFISLKLLKNNTNVPHSQPTTHPSLRLSPKHAEIKKIKLFEPKPSKAAALGEGGRTKKKKNLIFAPNPSDQSSPWPVCLLSSPICPALFWPIHPQTAPIKPTFSDGLIVRHRSGSSPRSPRSAWRMRCRCQDSGQNVTPGMKY